MFFIYLEVLECPLFVNNDKERWQILFCSVLLFKMKYRIGNAITASYI